MRGKRGHQGGARIPTSFSGRGKKGQQEIVGFVIIVVFVIIGLMFFLLYSLKQGGVSDDKDLVLGNLMSSILQFTTSCSIDAEKQTVSEMLRNCYIGEGCDNDARTSCNILEDELSQMLNASYKTEGKIDGLSFEFYKDDDGSILEVQNFDKITIGGCVGNNYRAFEQPVGDLDDVYVKLMSC